MKRSKPLAPVTTLATRRDAPLAPRVPVERPSPAAVYLQAKPRMAPSLRVVLRLLGADAQGLDVRSFPWESMRFENVSAVRTLLVEHLAPAYARKCFVAVRGVLKTAWKMQLLDRDAYERAVDVDPIKGDGEVAGRMLSTEEIARLFKAAMQDAPGAAERNAAIIAVASYGGLRREEISDLDLESYNQETGELHLVGKGRKRRVVFLPATARDTLSTWILLRRGSDPGPLFWKVRKGGRFSAGRRLGPIGVWKLIRRIAAAAGVADVTPHDFRRTYVSNLLDGGVDLATAQALAGHEDPKTTARYDRRGDERKKKAAEVLERMYGRRKK